MKNILALPSEVTSITLPKPQSGILGCRTLSPVVIIFQILLYPYCSMPLGMPVRVINACVTICRTRN